MREGGVRRTSKNRNGGGRVWPQVIDQRIFRGAHIANYSLTGAGTLYRRIMSDRPAPSSLLRLNTLAAVLGAALLALTVAGVAYGYASPVELFAGLGGALIGLSIGWGGRRRSSDTLPRAGDGSDQLDDALSDSMRTLINELVTPAFVISQAGRVLAHNPRARELFAGIEDGQPLHQVCRQPGLLEAVQRARNQGVTQTGEMAERTPGSRRLLATVSPLRNSSPTGDQVVLLVQFRDLSEQDRLAQLRSDFIANASHELRTPLASLKGFIETLQGSASGDAVARKRFLLIMEAQAARMARILDDLLSLSRIEMRAHVSPVSEVDIAAIVRAAVQGLEPIAREANITLTFDAGDTAHFVKGDGDELEQVFQNLIENAIKYGKTGGSVAVSIAGNEQGAGPAKRIAIAVADNGPGIAEEHLPRLTERFYRVDTAASRERGGTGLGLAIVKHILNRHRGELRIASVPGQGSTFTVVLDALPQTVLA